MRLARVSADSIFQRGAGDFFRDGESRLAWFIAEMVASAEIWAELFGTKQSCRN